MIINLRVNYFTNKTLLNLLFGPNLSYASILDSIKSHHLTMAIQLKISHPVKNIKVLKMAIKINSKGLMVASSSQFSVGDELILNFDQGLKLSGKVFKFSQNNQGQKGMIIQFIDLSEQNKQDLQALLEQEKQALPNNTSTQDPIEQETQAILAEKTIITDLNSLEHLALQSPDQNPHFVAVTLDEETLKSSPSNDLAQKTRVEMQLPKMAQNRKKKRRKRYLGILALFLALIALKLGVNKKFRQLLPNSQELKDKLPKVISVQDVKRQDKQKAIENKRVKQSSQKKVSPPKKIQKKNIPKKTRSSKTRLTQLGYVKTAAFYKVSISATQKLNKPNVSRLSNPKRIRIDFKSVDKGKARSRISINDQMLKSIHTQQTGSTTRIEIILNQSRYPRYDIKTYDRFADIFVYTVN
ncbi:AMIN domain-containing protein [bacterium]|nr:AMIN domain-containing protein [bacterium]